MLVLPADSSLWAPFLISSYSWYKPIPTPAPWPAGLVHPAAPYTSLKTGIGFPLLLPPPAAVGNSTHSYISWLLRPSPARAWLIPSSPSCLLLSFCQGEVRHSKSWYWGRTRHHLGWPASLVRMTLFPMEKNETKWMTYKNLINKYKFFIIPGSRRSLGGGNGNWLQYSCLGNPTDIGAWWPIVHWGCEESDTTGGLTLS